MQSRFCIGAAVLTLSLSTAASAAPLPRMHPNSPWYQRVDTAQLHPNSLSMITTWSGIGGGFGNNRMQIDFSIHVVNAAAGAPTRSIIAIPSAEPEDAYYTADCEALGSTVPMPLGGAIEGETDYTCDNFGGDCHLLIVQGTQIFEVYRANLAAGGLEAQCLARWRTDVLYPATGRGEHCTSADAAGFPMAPLLFNADEVAAAIQIPDGDLGHAIRFIVPNARMARDNSLGGVSGRLYVRPATHAGGPNGPVGSIPYGARLRLRGNFPLTNYGPAAQVVLRTLMRYGMVLADGGNVALTAESDLYTTNSWASLDFSAQEFYETVGAAKVLASDFQVIDTGPRIAETYDCVRSEPAVNNLFANGFE